MCIRFQNKNIARCNNADLPTMIDYYQWLYLIETTQQQFSAHTKNSSIYNIFNCPDYNIFQNYITQLLKQEYFSLSNKTYLFLQFLNKWIPPIVFESIQENIKPYTANLTNDNEIKYINIIYTLIRIIINISVQIEYNLNLQLLILIGINYRYLNKQANTPVTSTLYKKYIKTYLDIEANIQRQNTLLILTSNVATHQEKCTVRNAKILEHIKPFITDEQFQALINSCKPSLTNINTYLDTLICYDGCTVNDTVAFSKCYDYICGILWSAVIPYKKLVSIMINYIKSHNKRDTEIIDTIQNSINNLIFLELNDIEDRFKL